MITERARKLRKIIEMLAETLDDEDARGFFGPVLEIEREINAAYGQALGLDIDRALEEYPVLAVVWRKLDGVE